MRERKRRTRGRQREREKSIFRRGYGDDLSIYLVQYFLSELPVVLQEQGCKEHIRNRPWLGFVAARSGDSIVHEGWDSQGA
jgi:hypothetical protein